MEPPSIILCILSNISLYLLSVCIHMLCMRRAHAWMSENIILIWIDLYIRFVKIRILWSMRLEWPPFYNLIIHFYKIWFLEFLKILKNCIFKYIILKLRTYLKYSKNSILDRFVVPVLVRFAAISSVVSYGVKKLSLTKH